MRSGGLPRALVVTCLVGMTPVPIGCSAGSGEPTRLTVLASSELVDMRPVLDDLRRDTGIRLDLDYQGTVDASMAVDPADHRHDLAWLSTDHYLRLKLRTAGQAVEQPLGTSIMTSPVAIGIKPETAHRLRAGTPDHQISWADVADAAATGSLRFGMADPRHASSGLAALVGVATAAAGTGAALRPQDVTCDRLRGFFTGQRLSEGSAQGLADSFVREQDHLDALITYESQLLSLNGSGRLRSPLEIVYPRDGMVLSDYPLLLLAPAKRAMYDRVIDWLRSPAAQKKIMERTLRRPVDPTLPRSDHLREDVGNALYFPDDQRVIDRLLANYEASGRDQPARVIFLLDFSGSMRGRRIAELRATFAGLSGADDSSSGKFVRFSRGETLTVIRFGGHVLDEQSLTYGDEQDLDRLRGLVAAADFDGGTAIWSALDEAYQQLTRTMLDQPGRPVSIVLMTDGRNNAGIDLDTFIRRYQTRPATVRAVRTYAVRYGEADVQELDRAARVTHGRMVNATSRSLLTAVKETRGCSR
jgi:Ca-activated chloride channel family protein